MRDWNFVNMGAQIIKCFKTVNGMDACATIWLLWLKEFKFFQFQNRKRYGCMRDNHRD